VFGPDHKYVYPGNGVVELFIFPDNITAVAIFSLLDETDAPTKPSRM
jgi:hypothetical protein